jgi:hypothetical protein
MPLSSQAAFNKDKNAPPVQMKQRHFAFIASIIADMPAGLDRDRTARHFAKALENTNENFNRFCFLTACNYGEEAQ